MKGKIIHTVISLARREEWAKADIHLKSAKSSPGYEAYLPTYKLLDSGSCSSSSGISYEKNVKAFRNEYMIVEARANFDSDNAGELLKIKDELNAEAVDTAKDYGDLSLYEEYTFYCVTDYEDYDAFVDENRLMIARLLKDEILDLTENEIDRTLQTSLRYDKEDLTVIEWDGALLLDKDGLFDENITLIELANIQLLSLRALDSRLSSEIGLFKGFGDFRTPNIFRLSRFLKSIISVRSRSLLELDEIDNSIKLYGDWYSAKLYSIAAKKLYLASWREAVEQKLNLLENMFEMVGQRQGEIYNVTLEISIVLLIALEIILLVFGVA